MKNILFFTFPCFLIASINGGLLSPDIQTDPEVKMNVNEVIKYYGYPLETHEVTTTDGYILSMQRIPYGRKEVSGQKKPVVFLQHGLLDSSFTWINNGPEKSLAFILADRGFDVWLGNSRGNTYSRSHTKYSPFSKFFWDFTWDEMAKYDLPASINYALKISKADKLGYIGHSQGTQIAFAKFSEYSDLNSKVSAFVALAPVAYLGNLKTAIKYIASLGDSFNVLMSTVTTGEFLPNTQLVNAMSKFVCGDQMGSLACGNVAFLLQGFNVDNLNYTRMPIYVTHIPSGTSTKNIAHYAQSHLSNKFQKFDYGFILNKLKYNQIATPLYSLNTHGLPIAMFYGGNDWMAVKEDVIRAINELGDNVKLTKYIPEYNHIDFIWGANAYTRIYPDVIDFLLKYAN